MIDLRPAQGPVSLDATSSYKCREFYLKILFEVLHLGWKIRLLLCFSASVLPGKHKMFHSYGCFLIIMPFLNEQKQFSQVHSLKRLP